MITLVLIIVHLIIVALLITFLLPHFNEEKFLITFVIFLLPFINLIMGVMLLGNKLNISKAAIDRYKHSLEDHNDEIHNIRRQWETKYRLLEKSKFRRVRVGDVFMVPNNPDYAERARNKKLTVSEINNDSLKCYLKDSEGEHNWTVEWHYLKDMVFLNQEPFKPFEFIENETKRTS